MTINFQKSELDNRFGDHSPESAIQAARMFLMISENDLSDLSFSILEEGNTITITIVNHRR